MSEPNEALMQEMEDLDYGSSTEEAVASESEENDDSIEDEETAQEEASESEEEDAISEETTEEEEENLSQDQQDEEREGADTEVNALGEALAVIRSLKEDMNSLKSEITSLKSGSNDDNSSESAEDLTAYEYTPPEEDITEEMFDSIMQDPTKFREYLISGQKHAAESAYRQAITTLPKIIIHQMQQQQAISAAVEQFYTENDDLVEVKESVGQVANMIAGEHPEYTLEKVFSEAAKKVRKILKMPDPAKESGSTGNAFSGEKQQRTPKKSSQRRIPKKKTAISSEKQKLIDEINSI